MHFYLSNFSTNLNAFKLKSYACSLAVKNSCNKQSNALDKSVKSAPKELPLSTNDFHLSSIAKTLY